MTKTLAEWHQGNFLRGNGCCRHCGTKLITQSSGSVNGGYVKRCPKGCSDRSVPSAETGDKP
jgi:hypothetical protein